MTIQANLGTQAFNEELVIAQGHEVQVLGRKLKTNQGTLKAGTLVALNASREVVPYASADHVIGTGDAATKDFSHSLDQYPIEAGSVEVTDGTETFSDDFNGRLTGSAGGTGLVNYETGDVKVSFNAAPANNAPVTATCKNRLKGVLQREVDTTKEGSGLVIVHGAVVAAALKVGVVAPSAATLDLLETLGIYPL